jgi:MoaE-MoaD fusion protein
LTKDPIDARPLVQRLLRAEDGAVITFEGVVRNNTKGRGTLYLDYECYAPLALKTMEELGREILSRYAVHGIAIVHRVGRLRISEASVVIVVASAHRQAAYEASLEAINRLKQRVPIWKKEYFEDGEVWVEGAWDASVPRPAGTAP